MATLTVHRASVYPYGGKIYMPGVQTIDDKEADTLLSKTGIKRDIDAGLISIEKTKTRKPRKPEPEPEQPNLEA